jgi:hypothetical protein
MQCVDARTPIIPYIQLTNKSIVIERKCCSLQVRPVREPALLGKASIFLKNRSLSDRSPTLRAGPRCGNGCALPAFPFINPAAIFQVIFGA